ncbi:3-dehydroquinate synthase [Luteibaculum oceani]|uniref:3-dehydroquinate synthase n=2 Tax=Luteibaculum oceani TaxID=1294296 RepID=A0A5C6USS9_9FLAO|nr:3-dehydroquinate synthase [Luteibaculum oceani]
MLSMYNLSEITVSKAPLVTELNDLLKDKNTVALVDENVAKIYAGLFKDVWNKIILIRAGEGAKSLVYTEIVIQQLLELNIDRSSNLIAVGGGVTCDLTGFIASTIFRGINFSFIPTTLLAQVDAAIGGKNGVNFNGYKNVIGTLQHPDLIHININFLNTLSDIEFTSGMAEVIKHACIHSFGYFEFLKRNAAEIKEKNPEILLEMVRQSVEIKAQIVAKDPKEIGGRKILNYGHTYGHAIETHLNIPHGFAVSMGIIVANELAEKQTALSEKEQLEIKNLLRQFGLPTDLSSLEFNALKNKISKDKKRIQSKIDFILLEEIGSPKIKAIDLCDLP